jgi:hypothetical protein
MDLQQALNHRQNCILCQKPLTYIIPEYPNLQFQFNDFGLYIRSGHKAGIRMEFNYDGSYNKNKRHYKIYNEPISIVKTCQECQNHNIPKSWQNTHNSVRQHKKFSVGTVAPTSLNNMRLKECSYGFRLYGQNNTFSCDLTYEVVRHYDEQQFYHVFNSFTNNFGSLHQAPFNGSIDQIFSLNCHNLINLNQVLTLEDYIRKCKLLMCFS